MNFPGKAARSRTKRVIGAVITIVAIASVLGASAAAGNFVTVFTWDGTWVPGGGGNGRYSCWADMNQSSGNDAKEESAAGRAATDMGKFTGIRPEGQVADMAPCGRIGGGE